MSTAVVNVDEEGFASRLIDVNIFLASLFFFVPFHCSPSLCWHILLPNYIIVFLFLSHFALSHSVV